MNFLDWVLLVFLAGAALLGFRNGLVSSLLAALSIYVSLLISGQFAGRVLGLLPISVESEALSTALGYVIIFVALFIASRIAAAALNKALSLSFVGWVNQLGGVALAVVAWVFLAGALMSVGARYAYVFDNQDESGNPVERAVKELVVNRSREWVDELLTSSATVPVLLDVKDFLPGGMLGIAPADFSTALDILEERVADADRESGG